MNYNKFIKISCFSVLLIFSTSCDKDFLETIPKGNISNSTFWKTKQDAEVATNNLYNYLYDLEIFQWDAMSDISAADISSHGLTEIMYARGDQQSDNPYGERIWDDSYKGIRAVNDVLANIDKVESIDPLLLAQFKGEARFIRSYIYTYLVMFFGDVPLITEPLGIEEARNLPRTNKEDIWDFVEDEFQTISGDLLVSYNNTNKGRITQGAALAMKTRAMLWAGRYLEAKNAAKTIIDTENYELYPNYETLFSYQAENNTEVILDKQFIKDTYSNNVFHVLAPFSQNSSTSDFYPSGNMIDAYEMDNGLAIDDPTSTFDPSNPYNDRDPRLSYSVFVHGDLLPDGTIYDPRPNFGGRDDINLGFQTTGTGFNIKKYVNQQDLSDTQNNGINIILIRYADVLLMYAESKIELNEIDQSVYDAINDIRERNDVNMPQIGTGLSQQELREIVRHERLVELAFEGLRLFDIKRWQIAPDVMNGKIPGLTYTDNNDDLQTYYMTDYQRAFSAPRDYLWPIPQKEMEINPNYVQNTGY
tara:strand:+ start:26506 stop:28101 length:1596 start_codon:yes stop_codon:yes gene_type:complete